MKKQCAVYIRSSESEDTRELQLADLREHARARGLQVVRVYEDSGVGPVDERSGLKELLGAAKMGAFDFILIWRLDRMFCSHNHLTNVMQELEPWSIGLISVKDGIDTASEHGGLYRRLFTVFTHFHGRNMVERAQAGINGSRKKGCFFGRMKKIDREAVAKFMRQGLSQREMARRLNCSPMGIYKVRKELMAKAESSGAVS